MKKKQKRQKRMIIALASAMLLVIMVPIMAAFAGEGDDIVTPSDTVLTNPTENDPEQVDPEQVDPDQVDPDQTDPDQTDPVVPSIPAVSESDTNQSTTPDTDENAGTEANPEANVVEGSIIVEPNINNENNSPDGPDMTQDYGIAICYDLGYDYDYNNAQINLVFNGMQDSISTTVAGCKDTANGFRYWRDTQTGKIYHPGETLTIKVKDIEFSMAETYNPDTDTHGSMWVANDWNLKAIWYKNTLDATINAALVLNTPETEPNIYAIWDNDGYNRYHQWQIVEQTVTGMYNVERGETTFKSGTKIQIPADMVPTLAGDTFVEWNTAPDGSGKRYQPGGYITLDSESERTTELFAIFKNTIKKNLAIFYFDDWVTSNDTFAQLTVHYNDNGIIPSITFPKAMTNKTSIFAGWSNYKSGKTFEAGKTYYNVNIKELIDEDFSNHRFYLIANFTASWKNDTVYFEKDAWLNLEYEGGGQSYFKGVRGTYSESKNTWTYEGDHSILIPADLRPGNANGYTFKGWNTSEYGVGTMYQPGQTFVFTNAPWATLYATYQSNAKFKVVESSDDTVKVKIADPTVGLVLVDDKDINHVNLVVSKLDDFNKATVLRAISEQYEITEINGIPNIKALDLALVDQSDAPVFIEAGRVKIVLAYPNIPNARNYHYTIFHYHDGIAEEVPVEKFDGGLVFYARSFSPYALVWTEEPEEEQVSDNKPQEVVAPDTNEYIAVDADGNKYTADQIVIHGNTSPLSAESAAQFIKLVNGDPDRAAVYDITITNKDNKPLKLIDGKTIKVRLSVPRIGRTVSFRLYHISGDSAQSVSFSMNGGSPEFNASGFSPYVLTWHDINSTGSPGTGDDFSPVIFIVLILISASAAAGTIAYNKLKTKKSAVEA